MTRTNWLLTGLTAAALLVAGCSDSASTPAGTSGAEEATAPEAGGVEAPAGATLPETVFAAEAPAGAVRITDARATAKEGDVIVLDGQVGGTFEPFIDGRAVMTVVDGTDLYSCDEMPEDSCTTPWDFCCEDPKKVGAATVTVQVNDADGRPLKAGLKGWHGLKELTHVVVKGTVGPRPDPGVLIVNATEICVKP